MWERDAGILWSGCWFASGQLCLVGSLDASEVTQRVSHLTIDYSTPTWIPGSCCKTTQLVQLSRKVAVRLRLIEQISYQVFG